MKRPRVPRWQIRLPRLLRRHRRAEVPRPRPAAAGVLRLARSCALAAITLLVTASAAASFAESYRALYDWASRHGLSSVWALGFPLQVDVFIAVGELALFVALADGWQRRSRAGAWAVTLAGLAVSVAGNVGHVTSQALATRATAAVPPLAAAAALAVGLGVLKRVVEHRRQDGTNAADSAAVPSDLVEAAEVSLRATITAGNPWSVNQLQERFSLTRAQATKLRTAVLAESNGHPIV